MRCSRIGRIISRCHGKTHTLARRHRHRGGANYMTELHAFIVRVLTVLPRDA